MKGRVAHTGHSTLQSTLQGLSGQDRPADHTPVRVTLFEGTCACRIISVLEGHVCLPHTGVILIPMLDEIGISAALVLEERAILQAQHSLPPRDEDLDNQARCDLAISIVIKGLIRRKEER